MIDFLFSSFFAFLGSELLFPMCALIFVFCVFRLTWFLLIGGWNND